MKITIGQLRQIIKEEIRKVSLTEAVPASTGKKLAPINSAKLKAVLDAAVAQEVLDKGDAKYNTKILTDAPALVAMAMNDDKPKDAEKAYEKVMNGLGINDFEYDNADDKKLKAYFQKLSSLLYDVDGSMRDGELSYIPGLWAKVKAHIESFK